MGRRAKGDYVRRSDAALRALYVVLPKHATLQNAVKADVLSSCELDVYSQSPSANQRQAAVSIHISPSASLTSHATKTQRSPLKMRIKRLA